MNRYQHDNIDETISATQRDSVLKRKIGINHLMKKARRHAKQARHRANAAKRLETSRRS